MIALDIINSIKDYLSFLFVIPLVFCMGCYLSFQLNFIQFRKIREALILVSKKSAKNKENSISSFSAVAAVLGGNLGTGNIAGIAIALSIGGPGSLFWMWIMALLGAIIKFFGTYLGVLNRKKSNNPKLSQFVGGPMYYVNDSLKQKTIAKIYAVTLIFSALLVGNMVQINSISLPLKNFNIDPLFSSFALTLTVAWLILSKGKTLLNFISLIVPFMALVYLLSCLIILYIYMKNIPEAISSIFESAFDISSVFKAGASYTILSSIKSGFDRGLFATDAGIGLAPILHSQVDSNHNNLERNALKQGLISMLAPIIVMIICTITGLVLLVTEVWKNPCLESTNQCIEAFTYGLKHPSGGLIIIITLTLFALTTILTWFHCAQQALCFLVKEKYHYWEKALKLIFILLIPCGIFLKVGIVWILADIGLNIMLIINIYALFSLRKKYIGSLKKYV